MKLLIFSDIHGSLPAANFLCRQAQEQQPDAVVLLGDILYHGPRNQQPEGYNPKEVAQALIPLAERIVAVKGNCDSEVDEMVLPFPLAPLFSWVLTDGLRIMATHGHIYHPTNLPPLQKGDTLLYGHTHIPEAKKGENGIICINPGSLSIPKEDSPPCYARYENKQFTVLTKDGSIYQELTLNA